jgi:prepilin-type N-terminal cleavage/methylation domain-containing protein
MLNQEKGFTLIEVLISTAIFSVVTVIALGALLAMAEADRKAQSLKTVINNLNFALESMSRTIRTGYDYHCGSGTGAPSDCDNQGGSPNGSTYMHFTAADGVTKIAYCLDGTTLKRQKIISGSLNTSCSSSVFLPVTASEVIITSLKFIVSGSLRTDTKQPRVTILMSGYVPFKEGQKTDFNIQTTVTQRVYDQ